MINAFKKLFKLNKARANSPLERGVLASDSWGVDAWSGILPQTGYRYLIAAKHLRRLPGKRLAEPHRVQANNTHEFWAWYSKDPEQPPKILLFRFQYDLGSAAIAPYESETHRWRDESGYKKAIRQVDDCARSVTEAIAKAMIKAPPERLKRSANNDVDIFYAFTIEDAMLDCPHWQQNRDGKPLEQVTGMLYGDLTFDGQKVFVEGDRVQIIKTKSGNDWERFKACNPRLAEPEQLIDVIGEIRAIAPSSWIVAVGVVIGGVEYRLSVPKSMLKKV